MHLHYFLINSSESETELDLKVTFKHKIKLINYTQMNLKV